MPDATSHFRQRKCARRDMILLGTRVYYYANNYLSACPMPWAPLLGIVSISDARHAGVGCDSKIWQVPLRARQARASTSHTLMMARLEVTRTTLAGSAGRQWDDARVIQLMEHRAVSTREMCTIDPTKSELASQ